MADITLKAYLAHLDDLLGRRQYEEAEAHCKHILAKYPKNLLALRRLAKAQFESGRYPEAEKTYTTVLSMEPRSAEAYVGLSWVARQRGEGDQTVALLERAYEQDTTNQEVVQLLRDAHRTFNDRTNAKLPQTQYIAARQQWRSGLGQQAIGTLNNALAADPARADLRLLKAQIHMQMGEPVDAARACTDILKQLPDCVEANRLLAEFWKAQGRPSDAQRFVSRVESADPFLAFEIATGAPPPDEALTLSLLDFRIADTSATSTATPDWMGELKKQEPPTEVSLPKVEETIDWLETAQPTQDNETIDRSWLTEAADSSFDMPEDLSWLTDDANAPTDSGEDVDLPNFNLEFGAVAEDSPVPPSLDMDWMNDAQATDEGDTLPSISTKMAEEDVKIEQVLSEFVAMSPESAPAASGEPESVVNPTADAEEDWMSALNSASSDATTPDRENFDDFLKNFTSFSELSAEPSAQSSGTGLTGLLSGLNATDEDPADAFEPANPDVADIDPEDPLAWMRAGVSENATDTQEQEQAMPDLDALLGDEAFAGENLTAAGQDEPMPVAQDADDPFAWMKDQDVELVDAPQEETLWDDPLGVAEMGSLDENDVDPLAWMEAAGASVEEEIDPDADPLAWARESGLDLLDVVETANFKQTAALSADMAQLGAAESEKASPFDELTNNQPPAPKRPSGLLAFVKDEADSAQGGDGPMKDNDMPDWMKEPEDEPEKPKADAGDMADFDWMAVAPSESGAEIDWDAAPDAEAVDEAAPDWLASLENPVDAAEAVALSAKDDPAVKDLWEDAADDISASATPDWMAALRDDPAAEEPVADAADWMFSQGEASKDEIDGAADDMLSAPAASNALNTDELAAAPSWMADFAPAEAASDAAVEPAADAAPPSWMSGFAPAEAASDAAVEFAADADAAPPSWMSDFAPAEAASDAPVESAADADADAAPDWMSDFAPAEAASEAAAVTDSAPAAADEEMSLDWLTASAASDAIAAEEEEADAAPDWMSAIADAEAMNEAAPAAESAAEDDGSLDWLDVPAPAEEPLAAPAATGMDWLSMVTEDEDDGAGDQTNAFIAHDSLNWLTGDAEPEADEDDSASRAVSPEFMGEASADAETDFGGEFDFNAPELQSEDLADEADAPSFALSFLDEDEPTEDVATVELEGDPLPDWLMEARTDPGLKMDVDVPANQIQAQGELSGEILDDADLLEAEPPVQESLNASAVNSPDWLNAMVPGLEVGSDMPEDDEEPVAEAEFLNGGRSDFGWLTTIVDEELAPPAMAAPSRRSSRFPFSEPPLWLAMLREETQAAAPVSDFDSDDDSLPDWLKFDDAETN